MEKNPLRPFLFLWPLLLISCEVRRASVDYGKATVASLVEVKGEPLKEEQVPTRGGRVLHFPGDEKFQANGDIIVAGIRSPNDNERLHLFWKHRFKDCESIERKMGGQEIELACPKEGISVVYTDGSEFVSRIVEYEKK